MTIAQVAKHAGVSVATVSRVINDFPYVSAEVTRKVRAAIQEIGYVGRARQKFHQGGNGHAGRRTGYVGMVMFNVPLVSTQQPWMIDLIAGAEEVLAERGFNLVLMQVRNSKLLSPQSISRSRMDGVLLLGRACKQIRSVLTQMPCVLLMGGSRLSHEDNWADSVMADYEAIGSLAANYLLSRNHQRLAYLNPQAEHMGFQEIGRSFEAVTERAGGKAITFHEDIEEDIPVWNPLYSRPTVERFVRDIMEYPAKNRPTGLLLTDNDIARHLYLILPQHGLKPGKDLEVICRGYTHFFPGELNPSPATIYVDHKEIGRCAMERLLYRMKYPDGPAGARLLIPPSRKFLNM